MSFNPPRRKFLLTNPDTRTFKYVSGRVGILEDDMIFSVEASEIGDEYHTIHELYQHRLALTVALTRIIADKDDGMEKLSAYISKNHHAESSPMFEGYFIVWIQHEDKVVVSYHYSLKHWDDFKHLQELDYPPPYDGHKSQDVLERLMKL